MAYVAANLQMGEEFGIFRNHVWHYDGADSVADMNTAGYISNGYALGMQVGDRVLATAWTTAVPTGGHPATTDTMATRTMFEVVSVTVDGSADLSDGVTIALTDSD